MNWEKVANHLEAAANMLHAKANRYGEARGSEAQYGGQYIFTDVQKAEMNNRAAIYDTLAGAIRAGLKGD